jgi:hypothetical protein
LLYAELFVFNLPYLPIHPFVREVMHNSHSQEPQVML